MSSGMLIENLSYDQANIITESDTETKNLYMKGIFIQGGVKNANQRVYPVEEIVRAVDRVNEQAKSGYSVLGEVDHPEHLRINLDRVSHIIENMWIDGNNGYGKLRILPTPMGNIVRSMLEAKVKLGVSSRGQGNVNESNGKVSDFEIVTVDIVAQPSAPDAYPRAVYEGLMNMRRGPGLLSLAAEASYDRRAQKHLEAGILSLINELKIKR